MKIAVVRGLDGHTTCVGPDDYKPDEHESAMDAALGWHLEAGHLPAVCHWVEVDLPPIPDIGTLRAKADAYEFPKSFIEEMDA
jgi:hypothetical protein